MAILIEGMEMPKNCYTCPFCDYVSARCDAIRGTPYTPEDRYDKRPDWCPLRPAPEWIPVSERLPEDEGYVLAWRPGEHVGFFYADPRTVAYYTEQVNVTHWMPLPSTEGLNEA